MSLLIELHSIRCLNESNEASASDEAYVLVTVANLRPPAPNLPALPNLQVFNYGIYTDMDDDDPGPVIVHDRPFWGMDGTPQDIPNPAEVAIVVSVMEQDNGSPAQYAEMLNIRAATSLAASIGDPSPSSRATRLTADIGNVLNGVDLPIPFVIDDDHVGTQQLRLDGADLLQGGTRDRRLVFNNGDSEFEVILRISFRGWQHNLPGFGQTPVAPNTSPTSWYTTPENVQHIAYVGTDGLIHECFFFIGGNTGWLHNVLNAGQVPVAPGTSPTSWYTTPENVQHVAYVGTDGLIHECFFFIGGNTGWLHNVLNAGQVPVAPGTSPTSWFTPADNVQHVAYVGTDGLIHECFFFIGGTTGWLHNVLNTGQVPVAPGTSPTSWYTAADKVQHVAYVGTDGLVHECFFFIGGNTGWLHNVLNAGQVPVAPGTSPTSWYTTPENVQHVAYVGTDHLIHECFFFIGGTTGWLHNVLNTGQVPVAPGTSPTSWYTTPENVQHVAYVGTDGLIHECFFFIGGNTGWLHNIPSAGNMPAASDASPTSWYTTPENVQHIAYVGQDRLIHECFYFIP